MAALILKMAFVVISCLAVPSSPAFADDSASEGGACRTGDLDFEFDSDDPPALSLMQRHARLAAGLKVKTPNTDPAGWFGDFSQAESTYTYDGTLANRNTNPEINVKDGWDPSGSIAPAQVKSEQFFQETESGGYKQAWQSFYPPLPESIAGSRTPTGKWFTGTGDHWQQDYRSQSKPSSNTGSASWFDDSVNQLDGFGRQKFPGLGSDRLEKLYWETRSVSTFLSCADPDCTATSPLQAPFDSATEMHKDCKLDVKFHPTDFDDQYSGEMIEWVRVNKHEVGAGCHPMAHGCNMTMFRPLMACVEDAHVDLLIPEDGLLEISAKIPEVVDECKYFGNLLSGVATLTCLVTPKPPPTATPPPAKPVWVNEPQKCVNEMPLQCATRGCSAEIAVPGNMCDLPLAAIEKCSLSLVVNQTDFDNLDETAELIEYVKVNGVQVASDLKPGLNPCKWTWHGYSWDIHQKHSLQELLYSVPGLTDYDVTETVRLGKKVNISGKISQYVDECANNGYLFDAMATVTCLMKPTKYGSFDGAPNPEIVEPLPPNQIIALQKKAGDASGSTRGQTHTTPLRELGKFYDFDKFRQQHVRGLGSH